VRPRSMIAVLSPEPSAAFHNMSARFGVSAHGGCALAGRVARGLCVRWIELIQRQLRICSHAIAARVAFEPDDESIAPRDRGREYGASLADEDARIVRGNVPSDEPTVATAQHYRRAVLDTGGAPRS
jgi:hypothetical protein